VRRPQRNTIQPASQKKYQIAAASQRQPPFIVVPGMEDGNAFGEHITLALGTRPNQVWTQCRQNARQRRVLRFISVDVPAEPLHAASDVRRLIGGVVRDRVSGGYANGSKKGQSENQPCGTVLHETLDALCNGLLDYDGGGRFRAFFSLCLAHEPQS
jgi:hypothetical protein